MGRTTEGGASEKGALRVVLAQPRGFCAGVERAIEIVERALAIYGPPVYVRHEIVHNRHVVESLREKGAVFVDEPDDDLGPLAALIEYLDRDGDERLGAYEAALMNTPMAIEGISAARGIDREELIRQRDAQVPLGGKQGDGWDVANASLFLASEEASYINGICLPIDGGVTR